MEEGAVVQQSRSGGGLFLHLLEVQGPGGGHRVGVVTQLGFGFFEPLEPLFAVAGEVVDKGHPVGDDVGGGLFEGQGQVAQFGGEGGSGGVFRRGNPMGLP